MFIEDFIENCKDEKSLGCYAPSDVVKEVGEKMKTVFAEVESKGKTQQLWMEYHRNVTIVKYYIRADFNLHLTTIAKMLPTFPAAGHGQYAQAAKLTLEQVLKFRPDVKAFFYYSKFHTVKYSVHQWSGVWTDMSIEQTLMRFSNSLGGSLVGD